MSTMPLSPALRRLMMGIGQPDVSPTFDDPMMEPQPRVINPTGRSSNPLASMNGFDDSDPLAELMNFQADTRANEEFLKLLHEFPVKKKASFVDRLVGGLSQDPKAVHPQYYEDLANWKTKIVPYQQAADNETQQNVNKRLIAGNIATNRYRFGETDRKAQADADRLSLGEDRNKIARDKLAIDQDRANGGELKQNESGQWYMLFKDGSMKRYDLNGWSPGEVEELKQKGRSSLVTQRANEAIRVGGELGWSAPVQLFDDAGNPTITIRTNKDGRKEIVDMPDDNVLRTKPPGTASQPRPQSAADRQKEIVNNANQTKAKNPDWAQWITVGRTGVNIQKPGSAGFFSKSGPDKATYDKMYEAIYGEKAKDDSVTTPVITPNATAPASNLKAPDGEELVPLINLAGKTVGVRKSMVEMALRQGYKKPGAK